MNSKKRYNRQSIRLTGYDYSQPGFYFVTICTKYRKCLFGNISDGLMNLNEFGIIAKEEWNNNPEIRDNVVNHAFVVMPNHIHGIIEIANPGGMYSVGAYRITPLRNTFKSKFRSPSNNLGAIIRGYKSALTKRINQYRRGYGIGSFLGINSEF